MKRLLKKRLLLLLLSFLMTFSTCSVAFAATGDAQTSTSLTTNANTKSSETMKPITDYWLFQNETPIIGNWNQYNTNQGSSSHDYTLYNPILSIGIAGVSGALAPHLPNTSLSQSISQMIYAAVVANIVLNTDHLYTQEYKWGYDPSPSLNYEVVQMWYSDAQHTKYICTTTYYASFI